MDMREIEPTAQVSNKPRNQTMFSQLKKVNCHTNWCKLGCFRRETQSRQRVIWWLKRRRHETSKISGCSASEHHSKTFGVLIVLFFFSSPLSSEKTWSVIICEGDKRTISCENDQRTIDVVDANYGRLDSNTCNHPAISNTNCKAENSLVIVRMKCIEEASCEFHAVHSAFGHNPCPGTFKCLEVKFKCEFGSVAIAIFAYCELGGEMALCYHLGGICFRIASGVHFQSRA